MTTRLWAVLVILGTLLAGPVLCAEEHPAAQTTVNLPPDLLNLLRAEMREIAGGIQGIGL